MRRAAAPSGQAGGGGSRLAVAAAPGPSWRRRLRGLLPWLVAAGILGALAVRLPRAQILHAFATGPVWTVALFSAAVVVAVLAADAWATLAAFAATGVRCPFRGVLLARGATYLLGLLNTVVGQGGLGVYLHRAGVAPLRALGTVLFLLATQVGALTGVAALGLAAQLASAGTGAASSWPLVALLAAGFAVYLVLVTWRPAWLARRAVLAPALHAGAGGFCRAAAARLPQMLLMIVGLWLGLQLWGVALPLGRGLVVIAVVVLITVVPVAPSGIGTMELAVVGLAADYAPAAGLAAQRASVLAFTLVYHLAGVLTQAAIGLACLALVQRRPAVPDGESAADLGTGCLVLPLAGAPPAPQPPGAGAG